MSGTKLKSCLSEVSGAFGDIGMLFPLFMGLVIVVGMNPVSLLLSAGFFYVCAGLYFRIPMPVQPLKAVAALAIGAGLGPGPVAAAGLVMGVLLLLLALNPVASVVAGIFKRPIVRGIQFGLGIMLVIQGWKLIFGDIPIHKSEVHNAGCWHGFVFPKLSDMWIGLTMLVVPQLPLTIGNAVVSTSDAARKYYGEGAKRAAIPALAISMGVANIISALFHGLPMCHGSGGVTAHYRFGARTGAASVIIGASLILLAVFLKGRSVGVIESFPLPVLGAMLIYVGVLHACLIMDLRASAREFLVAASIGVFSIITGNLAAGIVSGIILNFVAEQVARMRREFIS